MYIKSLSSSSEDTQQADFRFELLKPFIRPEKPLDDENQKKIMIEGNDSPTCCGDANSGSKLQSNGASATSQRSNRQNWFQTKIVSHNKSMLGDGRSTKKTAPHLSDPRHLLKCDALSCEGVVKTFQTSLRRNKELRPVSDLSPSMLLYGLLSLFRTNFPRCHALLCFVLFKYPLQALC